MIPEYQKPMRPVLECGAGSETGSARSFTAAEKTRVGVLDDQHWKAAQPETHQLPRSCAAFGVAVAQHGSTVTTAVCVGPDSATLCQGPHYLDNQYLRTISVLVDEQDPGGFFWVLMESTEDATVFNDLEASTDSEDTWEAALDAGVAALKNWRRIEPAVHATTSRMKT